MLQDLGVSVDHTTKFRWLQTYADELEKQLRPHLQNEHRLAAAALRRRQDRMMRAISRPD